MIRRTLTVGLALLLGPGCAAAQHNPTQPASDTSWVKRAALYEVFVQDFSSRGDFRGVIDGLDKIQSSGANTLWIMPVHPIGVVNRKGVLGSPYAAMDYRAINPTYGTGQDFKALVEAVHARGMKIILDWVPDHTSPDNPWVKAHPEYYVKNDKGEPSVPRDASGNLTDWTDVVQLDYTNPGLRQAMITEMQYWLKEYGLDGFRVDVAGFIPPEYWREAIPALRASVPRRILMLAEWGDLEWNRAGFDLTYSWDSYSRLKSVWKGGPASTFVDAELADLRNMPAGGARMRFTTNHDETAWDNPPVAIFGQGAGARAAFVAAALLPGRPLLYNGQEVESPQKLPLFERDTVQWNQPEANEARSFYRKILDLATTNPDFISGAFDAVHIDKPSDVIAYRRGTSIVLVNTRPREIQVSFPSIEVDGTRDVLSGVAPRHSTVTLPPHGAMVLMVGSQ